MTRICICGGGSLGHTVAGYVGAKPDFEVSLLTRHPELWGSTIDVIDPSGKRFAGQLRHVTGDAAEVIPGSDIVLLCLPGFAIESTLRAISPYLKPTTMVGTVVSSTGFFFMAHDTLESSIPLFGFQRVPFIARTVEYGRKACLKGYKTGLNVAFEHAGEAQKRHCRTVLEKMLDLPVTMLGSHYEVSLTNSNPLLHTSRIYTLWRDWRPGITFDCCPEFYSDWTLEASQYYIAMDNEFQTLLKRLPVTPGAIPRVLDYYESTDAASLTRKLASIPAFKGIPAPMTRDAQGRYAPDLHSRYFTEDFPFGLHFIVKVARETNFPAPIMTQVYNWGMHLIQA